MNLKKHQQQNHLKNFNIKYLPNKSKDTLVPKEKIHNIARFSCELCKISYKKKDNLKRHIKSKHSTMSEALLDKLTKKTKAKNTQTS